MTPDTRSPSDPPPETYGSPPHLDGMIFRARQVRLEHGVQDPELDIDEENPIPEGETICWSCFEHRCHECESEDCGCRKADHPFASDEVRKLLEPDA